MQINEKMIIDFSINNQRLTLKKDKYIVSNSKNYVELSFDFSTEWLGLVKTLIIYNNAAPTDVYQVILLDNKCMVPAVVLNTKGKISIGVVGQNNNAEMIITTNVTTIEVIQGCYTEGTTPPEPELNVYEQIVSIMQEQKVDATTALVAQQVAVAAKDLAVSSKDAAKVSEDNAKISETNSKTSETNSKASETIAVNKANEAEDSAGEALNSEVKAKGYRDEAKISKNNAYAYSESAKNYKNNAKDSADDTKSYRDETSELKTDVQNIANAFDTNVTTKTNTFNDNSTSKINTFDTNATNKTTDFNSNATSKTNLFNSNYDEKIIALNELEETTEGYKNTTQEYMTTTEGYKDLAYGYKEEAKTSETNAGLEAERALNNILNGVSTHNQSNESHPSILEDIRTVEAIARGKATGYVFDTYEDMLDWLEIPDNVEKLVVGDNLYIRDIGVKDYWWDGITYQELEAEAPDLTNYYTKSQVDYKMPILITRAEYDALVIAGTVIADRTYDIIEEV